MAIKDLDWEGMDPPGPATEGSEERGYEPDTDEDELGESEEMDDDEEETGDIADEGTGHRG
jgi:hypothetical protein